MLKSKVIIIIFVSIIFCQPVVHGQWMQSPVINQGFISAITIKDSVIFLGGSNLSDSAVSYFYSKDYGDSWTECFNSQASHPNDIVITDDYIFTGEGFEGGYIFRTSDWGLNWEECYANVGVTALAYCDSNLYAGTTTDVCPAGVLKSSDNGNTWTEIWNGVSCTNKSLIAFDSLIFVGTEEMGIYGSSDYGNTWNALNNGLPVYPEPSPYPQIKRLILFDKKIFAGVGSSGGGLFYTTDFGLSWQQFNEGSYIIAFASNGEQLFIATRPRIFLLLKQEMKLLDITGDLPDSLFNYSMAVCGDNLFVGTGLNGLWYRSISGLTEVKKETETPTIFSLSQNYPNPFNPTTTFQYALKDEAAVTIKIYNILGKEIITLVNETQPAGYQSITWNGTDHSGNPVPSGIYICQMNAGNYTKSQKMVLMK